MTEQTREQIERLSHTTELMMHNERADAEHWRTQAAKWWKYAQTEEAQQSGPRGIDLFAQQELGEEMWDAYAEEAGELGLMKEHPVIAEILRVSLAFVDFDAMAESFLREIKGYTVKTDRKVIA